MKVVHLTHTDINKDARVVKSMKALQGLSWVQVIGIGIENKGERERSKVLNDSLELKTISLSLLSKKINFLPRAIKHPLVLLEFFFKTSQYIREQNPSVLHCHDTLVLPIAIFHKIFKNKLKVIYDAHELESDRNGINWLLSRGVYLCEKISWRYLDHFITVSPSILKWYEKEFGPKPSSLILNSPQLNALDSYKQSKGFREIFKVADHEKLFIYVGELSVGRGIDNLLKIFKESKSRILFLGYGPLVEKVRKYEKEFHNIHYHEAIDSDILVKQIREADVGICFVENVSLSDYYCLPNKLFEYAFAGIPVLASDFPDIRMFIDKYSLGSYCQVDSLKTIKNKIQEYESMDEIIKNDLSKLDEISWQRQELDLVEIYREFKVH